MTPWFDGCRVPAVTVWLHGRNTFCMSASDISCSKFTSVWLHSPGGVSTRPSVRSPCGQIRHLTPAQPERPGFRVNRSGSPG